jgi:transposase
VVSRSPGRSPAATANDVTQLLELLDRVPPVRGRIGRPRRRPRTLIADRGYDYDKYRRLVWQRGIKPIIARRQTEHGSGLGRHRWVVERTFAWLHNRRRLLIRTDPRDDIHEGFLALACCLGCWRRLENSILDLGGLWATRAGQAPRCRRRQPALRCAVKLCRTEQSAKVFSTDQANRSWRARSIGPLCECRDKERPARKSEELHGGRLKRYRVRLRVTEEYEVALLAESSEEKARAEADRGGREFEAIQDSWPEEIVSVEAVAVERYPDLE